MIEVDAFKVHSDFPQPLLHLLAGRRLRILDEQRTRVICEPLGNLRQPCPCAGPVGASSLTIATIVAIVAMTLLRRCYRRAPFSIATSTKRNFSNGSMNSATIPAHPPESARKRAWQWF